MLARSAVSVKLGFLGHERDATDGRRDASIVVQSGILESRLFCPLVDRDANPARVSDAREGCDQTVD